MSTPHQILGINPGAGLAEIKKAYRKKAMQWHPDKNSEPGAREKFLELTEAYYALTNPTKNNPIKKFTQAYSFSRKTNPREKMRERARRAAQMRYEEWLDSDEYEFEQAFGIFMTHVMVIGFGLFLFGCAISFMFMDGGIISTVLILIFLGPLYFSMVKSSENLSVNNLVTSFKILQAKRPVGEVLLTLFNVCVVLFIGLRTVIPLYLLLSSYVVVGFLAFLYYRKKEVFSLSLLSIGAWPSTISVLLLLNYFVSFKTIKEVHSFKANRSNQSNNTGIRENGFRTITLKDSAYHNCPGLRLFYAENCIDICNTVEFEFKEGFFGIKVMKGYKLNYKP